MNVERELSHSSEGGERWSSARGKLPKEEVIYFCQVILIYIVVIACLINLSFGAGLESIWWSLLSGSVGYLLPSPQIGKKVHTPQILNKENVTFSSSTPL